MIMDCVSSICATVEAAMINKTIRQIWNSMGPACVTHQVQLNKNNWLPAKWEAALLWCHSQLSIAWGTVALDIHFRAGPCLMGGCETEGGWMFAKPYGESKLGSLVQCSKFPLCFCRGLTTTGTAGYFSPRWVHKVLAAAQLQLLLSLKTTS